MANPFESDSITYCVLVNSEGQHSLWPSFRDIPHGWSIVGPTGDRNLCLRWIESNWIDMRPKSISEPPLSGIQAIECD
jgi:MbtH protein